MTWKDSSVTRKRETMRRHTQENYEKDLKAVQELEGRLPASNMPLVSWVFELSKMNQSGTGYKLHKHIGKALQTCSVAIQAALTQYNTAAKDLGRQTLEFDELCWAEEEVIHLNVEICQVITYLIDEDWYLQACEALYQDNNPILAYQISRYHTICSRFTLLHLRSLEKISHLSGFSGTLTLGISVSCGLGDSMGVPQQVCMDAILSSPPVAADDREDNANEDADEDHASTLEERYEALQNILSITMDV
ncbi:hypothetical protein EDD15DRAFT_2197911 [Pisolithus albus]|nr:hypothetical protein EDD15DRAFT_2197911 [Pisolithus albus]